MNRWWNCSVTIMGRCKCPFVQRLRIHYTDNEPQSKLQALGDNDVSKGGSSIVTVVPLQWRTLMESQEAVCVCGNCTFHSILCESTCSCFKNVINQ
jgi:hypothetical protein